MSRSSSSPAARRSRTRCGRSSPTSCRSTRSRRRRRSSRSSRRSSPTGRAHTELVDVESEHSAMSAAIGSALAGARTMTATSSQGLALMAEVVYIAAVDARADRDGARQPRAVGADQHPLRPLRLDADPRLGSRPALRRERPGGVRPDGDRATARRAPRRPPAGARLPGRLHDHPLGRAGGVAPGRGGHRLRRRVRGAVPDARPSASLDAGPVRDAGLLLRAAPRPGGGAGGGPRRLRRARGRARAALRTHATVRSRHTGSTARRGRSSRSARPPAPSRTSSTSSATRARRSGSSSSPRSGPSRRERRGRARRRRAGRRARPRRFARRTCLRSTPRSPPPCTGAARRSRDTSTASAGATCTPTTSATVFAGARRR